MNWKNVISVVSLVLIALSPAMADIAAGTAEINRIVGYYSGNGGEFSLDKYTGLTNAAYADVARNKTDANVDSPSFQTFCVETNEYVYTPNDSVNVTINTSGPTGTQAVLGGQGGPADPLSYETAYLYTQFATGNLSGYNYTAGAGRAASANSLQLAIWELEGEGNTNDVQADAWIAAAQAAVAGSWGNTIGRVRVLNMTNPSDGALQQDMLYLAVPAPGVALLSLLGLGIVGWIKRRVA